MTKKTKNDLKLEAFPEEIDKENGVRVYGETSYENQMAVLSQFLHNGGIDGNDIEARGRREDIVLAIQEFLERKKNVEEIEDYAEYATKVAESPIEYPLFADFFNVPFPDPKPERFTFIHSHNSRLSHSSHYAY